MYGDAFVVPVHKLKLIPYLLVAVIFPAGFFYLAEMQPGPLSQVPALAWFFYAAGVFCLSFPVLVLCTFFSSKPQLVFNYSGATLYPWGLTSIFIPVDDIEEVVLFRIGIERALGVRAKNMERLLSQCSTIDRMQLHMNVAAGAPTPLAISLMVTSLSDEQVIAAVQKYYSGSITNLGKVPLSQVRG